MSKLKMEKLATFLALAGRQLTFGPTRPAGMMSAMASFGLVLLWDVDGGLTQIDKYLYSNEDFIKAGALLACGIVNSGVRNECDPALALLSDYLLHQNNLIRVGSILGESPE